MKKIDVFNHIWPPEYFAKVQEIAPHRFPIRHPDHGLSPVSGELHVEIGMGRLHPRGRRGREEAQSVEARREAPSGAGRIEERRKDAHHIEDGFSSPGGLMGIGALGSIASDVGSNSQSDCSPTDSGSSGSQSSDGGGGE